MGAWRLGRRVDILRPDVRSSRLERQVLSGVPSTTPNARTYVLIAPCTFDVDAILRTCSQRLHNENSSQKLTKRTPGIVELADRTSWTVV